MPNTKSLSHDERKKAKRESRKELKKLHLDLGSKDRKEFRAKRKENELTGIKQFLAEKERKAAEE